MLDEFYLASTKARDHDSSVNADLKLIHLATLSPK